MDKNGTLKCIYYGRDITSKEKLTRKSSSYVTVDIKDGVLVIPEGVTAIGDFLLRADEIRRLVLPRSVRRIGEGALRDCTALEAVELPGVVAIDKEAFLGCANLTRLTLPDTLTDIGEGAFAHCSALGEVTFGSGLKKLGRKAFAHTGIKTLELPDSLKAVGGYAFSDCTKLCRAVIPAGLDEICEGAFEHCPALTGFTINNKDFTFSGGCLVDERRKLLLLSVGCKTVPDGIRTVGAHAYSLVVNGMRELVIPDSVESIGAGAFSGQGSKIERVTFGARLARIGKNAFNGCAALTEITLPDGLVEAGYGAFRDCAAARILKLPDSVEIIGENAFYGCAAINELSLPASLKSLGSFAFEYCTALKTVTFRGAPRSVGGGAFLGCTALCDIALPEGLRELSCMMFQDCPALTRVSLPASLKRIATDAFSGCTALEAVRIEGAPEVCADAFSGCTAIKSLHLSENVCAIDPIAFRDCTALCDITVEAGNQSFYAEDGCLIHKPDGRLTVCNALCRIPEGVRIIDDYICDRRRVKEIYLPSTVKRIGFYAFDDCTSLETVHFAGTRAEWHDIDFNADEYYGLQAYGDHEDDDGVPYWYFTRCRARVVCTDGEEELFLY